MLAGTMALLAWRTDTPELQITADEEKVFLMRVQNVLRHYSVKTTQKAMDSAALAGCVVNLAAPRAFAIHQRLKAERLAEDGGGQVLHFRPRPRPAPAPAAGDGQAAPEAAPYVPSAPMGEPDGEGF